MRVLLIGGGGREHALAWKIAKSDEVTEVLCAPGNAGIAMEPKVSCVPVAADDLDGLVDLSRERRPDLVVVGPEMPLALGLVDRLDELGIATMGPKKTGAQLEGSKVFAKELMQRHGIPTAGFKVFSEYNEAIDFIESNSENWVIKADGLAAGKGVFPCTSQEECKQALHQIMVEKAFGEAGSRVVVESFLEGEEVSCIGITDGKRVILLASSQDHKRAHDGDRGPNTGGMGAYSPAPVLDKSMEARVKKEVFDPLVAGMASEGIEFRGIIYAGLMIDRDGPKVLEFNARLGDPETQPLLIRMRSDLVPALVAAAKGDLSGVVLEWDERPSVCVVMAAGGYPGSYQKGKPIDGLGRAAEMEDVFVFHAGTTRQEEKIVTAGGRVLGVCALGSDIRQAVDRAYAAVDLIRFDDAHYRKDIGHRALERLS
jgi:phosphoribosylamine---glycine ligase